MQLHIPDIQIKIKSRGHSDAPLCADLFLHGELLAEYRSGGPGYLSEIHITHEKELTFIAWVNKNKVASVMMKCGWKSIYPTIQKIPYHAQFAFVSDSLIQQNILDKKIETLQKESKRSLLLCSAEYVESISWPDVDDFHKLAQKRSGLLKIQRHYDRLVKKRREDQFVLNSIQQLHELGVITTPEAHQVTIAETLSVQNDQNLVHCR